MTLDERQAAAERHFDRYSALYGRSRALRGFQRAALRELALGPGDALLDVACGTGDAVVAAAGVCDRVAGVDIADSALATARERAAGAANVELRRAPADRLPFGDASFDAVLCTSALHHLPDPRAALAEVARVLRPGGRAALGDFRRDSPVVAAFDVLLRRVERGHVGFVREGWAAGALGAAGLAPRRPLRLARGTYFVIGADAS